ncbi:Ankyrin repeats-containig protein [Cardinium endosymbiont cBtQ1 of Bemisia tabaci]|nr:Ankyrin repeats-containig protein [Cardinium endosymbiont cBtQ1 of Bemisia tabaci]
MRASEVLKKLNNNYQIIILLSVRLNLDYYIRTRLQRQDSFDACNRRYKIEFAKLLIGNKTNIDLKDNSGRDALTYATTCNRKDFIDLLKNNSTNLNT